MKLQAITGLALACCLVGLGAPRAQADDGYEMINELVGKLQAVVPEGWKVTINQRKHDNGDRDDVNIEVWREQPAAYEDEDIYAPNQDPGELPEGAKQKGTVRQAVFGFNLRLQDYLSPEDHARLIKENEAILQKRAEFTNALSNVERHGKAAAFEDNGPIGYYPKTPEEKKLVQEFIDYHAAHPMHRIVQNCHYRTLSFTFYDQRMGFAFIDDKVNDEFTAVRRKIFEVVVGYGKR